MRLNIASMGVTFTRFRHKIINKYYEIIILLSPPHNGEPLLKWQILVFQIIHLGHAPAKQLPLKLMRIAFSRYYRP